MFDIISHFTVGWNGTGNLVGIPVMRTRETVLQQFREETIEEIALKRKCTVLMIDPKSLPVDYFPTSEHGYWSIRNNIISARNPMEAKAAIESLTKIFAKKGIDISTIECNSMPNGSGKITS